MSEKSNSKLNDDLIREAIKLEIDCIEVPPASLVWPRIESRLEQPRPPVKKRSFSFTWSRAAAVAAACLVLTLGGIGIFRTVQFTAPLADSEMTPETADDVGALRVDDDQFEVPEEEDVKTDLDLQIALGEADPRPPDWPSILPGDYTLDEEIILVEAGEPEYRGAVYYSSDVGLLLVKSEVPGEDMPAFLNHLGKHIQVELQYLEETNGFIRLAAEELPGLAWPDNGGNQALLVLFGFMSEEELKRIAALLN